MSYSSAIEKNNSKKDLQSILRRVRHKKSKKAWNKREMANRLALFFAGSAAGLAVGIGVGRAFFTNPDAKCATVLRELWRQNGRIDIQFEDQLVSGKFSEHLLTKHRLKRGHFLVRTFSRFVLYVPCSSRNLTVNQHGILFRVKHPESFYTKKIDLFAQQTHRGGEYFGILPSGEIVSSKA